jgi:lactate 2-monooxygenase
MTEEVWSYVAGGAGDEHTQRANVEAFSRWGLVPRVLSGAAERDLSVELFGTRLPTPLLLAPVGVIGICDRDGHGDLLTARASAATGVPMVASTLSQDPLEQVAAELGGTPGWFQLYPPNDRELTESLVQRAEAAGYSAIVVTLDTLTLGWRERDLRNAYLPFLEGKGVAQFVADPVFRAQLSDDEPATAGMTMVGMFPNLELTWDDLAWLRDQTALPLLAKGILTAEDALRAREAGLDGIVVSNHGGRQVDGAVAALDALVEVRSGVGDGWPVLIDGGIRRGSDVLKALALGADAVLLGRPYVYALAVGGEAGVERMLEFLSAEIDLTLALCGGRNVRDLDASFVSEGG